MEIVNFTEKDVDDALNLTSAYGWGDHYRKYTEYDRKNIAGIYWKYFDDRFIHAANIKPISEVIKSMKECSNFEFTWEHYHLERLFALINRLENVYKAAEKKVDLKSPVLNGIVLCDNFPVGVLIPKELIKYNSYSYLEVKNPEIIKQYKEEIKDKTKYLISLLLKNDIYPTNIYGGNVVINPDNPTDVRLDFLDESYVSRVESKDYVRELKMHRGDLVGNTWSSYNRIFE